MSATLFADLAKLAAAVKEARTRTGYPRIQTQAEAGGVRVGQIVKRNGRNAFDPATDVLPIADAIRYVNAM